MNAGDFGKQYPQFGSFEHVVVVPVVLVEDPVDDVLQLLFVEFAHALQTICDYYSRIDRLQAPIKKRVSITSSLFHEHYRF